MVESNCEIQGKSGFSAIHPPKNTHKTCAIKLHKLCGSWRYTNDMTIYRNNIQMLLQCHPYKWNSAPVNKKSGTCRNCELERNSEKACAAYFRLIS
jgi:hypothetical protein